jgi:Phytanoyl-CoA dioxygenase (PhyH)
MVTDQQVDHYQTFGFLVLPRYLDEQETAELRAELDRALRDGYGAHFDDRDNWWGHSLPMMSRQRTPTSLALVEDDRFLGAARRLLDTGVLPTYAEGNLLFGEAGFHTDCGTGTPGVKFVAYLEPLTAASGALRLMPGSYHPDFSAAIDAWEARNRAMDAEQLWYQITGLPCYVAETQPGDVIAFNWHTRHASIGGKDRRQWTISYAKDPRTAEEVERLQDFFGSVVPDGDEPYDHDAYPCYDQHWLGADPVHPQRAALTGRMRELGLFEMARGR